MGRHNTVAGRMAESAAAKARLFTKLAREIMVSARAGSDVNLNSALRVAVNKAKDNSMPKDSIERAIKKGAGELGAAHYEEVTYEGYGPGNVALIVDVLTDNRNRTHPELRKIFQKHGGTLGEMGTVAWMFQKKGIFIISLENYAEEKIMEIALEAGAEDLEQDGNSLVVSCPVTQFAAVREALVQANIAFQKTGIEWVASTPCQPSEEELKQVEELIEKLEEHDDVQSVYSNL